MVRPYLAPATRSRNAVAQAEHVSRHMRPRLSRGGHALHVSDHLVLGGIAIDARHGAAEEARVPRRHRERILIRGAADHDAVDVAELRLDLVATRNAAIEDEAETRKVMLQAVDRLVAQRRHLPVFLRAQAMQPGIAGMDDEDLATAPLADGADEIAHESVVLEAIDADAMFHGHRNGNGVAHRLDAIGDQLGLGHETGAERAALDPLARAAAVEVDLVVAPTLTEPRTRGESRRVAAAELQRKRSLFAVEIEMARCVAVQQGARGHHLGV